MSTLRPHTMVICCKFKKESHQPLTLYTSFHVLLNVYSCMSGADNPKGQNFDVHRNHLSLRSFNTSFKKISLKPDFIQFFHDFIHVYSPGAGADNPFGMKFWCQQEHLVTSIICCKFQKISLKSDFILFFFFFFFFHVFIHVYSTGAGKDSPQGTKFWFQQKCLVTSFICCKFQKKRLRSDFKHFFHDLIHVYSPGAGVDSPQGTQFWCQQKGLITLPICCKFQRNTFEVWFYTIFFMI